MDDPSGYSTVENLHLPMPDPKLEIRHYGRTQAQDNQLGFYTEEQRKVLHGEADSMDRTDEGLDVNQVNRFDLSGGPCVTLKLKQLFRKSLNLQNVVQPVGPMLCVK